MCIVSYPSRAGALFVDACGLFLCRGLATGIYTTNSAEAVAYVLKSSNSNVCVVENQVQLQKVLTVWDELPELKAIVQYKGKPETDKPNVYSVSYPKPSITPTLPQSINPLTNPMSARSVTSCDY